ncbi:MAG: DUF881 domain-containing protein [Clostridiales bacterium]|nr:DUF881 domain-containing protein [Clostridiales bacterium]
MNNNDNRTYPNGEVLDGEVLIPEDGRPQEGPAQEAGAPVIPARRSGGVGIFVVCLVFGLLLAIQFKSVELSEGARVTDQLMRAEELQTLLNKERQRSQELYEELLQYKDDVASYREMALVNGDYAAVMARELERAELIAGIIDVEGPGITVTMQDSLDTIEIDPLLDPSYYIIHDDDLLRVINELRDAGAEAISINGERLISTSEIRCAGSIVSINNNRYATPYVIRAIGDPQTLHSALTMRGGVLEQLYAFKIRVDIQQNDSIIIKGYTGKTSFKYAKEYRAEAPAS